MWGYKQQGWLNFCIRSNKISGNLLLSSMELERCPSSSWRKTESLLSKEDEAEGSGNDQYQAQLRAQNHTQKRGLNEHLRDKFCDLQNTDSQTYALQEGNKKTSFIENLIHSRGKSQGCDIKGSLIKGQAIPPQAQNFFILNQSYIKVLRYDTEPMTRIGQMLFFFLIIGKISWN